MSEATFDRARRKAVELAEKGHVDGITVVAIRLIINGWDQSSARCAEVSTHAVEFSRKGESGYRGMVMWPEWREPHRALYAIDDGVTVRPMYVSGWQGATHVEEIYIGTFPVDVNEDGTPRLRSDNGRPVDFSNWLLSASRAFHVKVRRDLPALAGQPF
jgi:hypothetical protein